MTSQFLKIKLSQSATQMAPAPFKADLSADYARSLNTVI
jgi:hypothetical protein